jgi:hypothetical protein
MAYLIDIGYFKELAGKNPDDISRAALCSYDRNEKAYRISVWSKEYVIFPDKRDIISLENGISCSNSLLGLFIVYYLLNSSEINPFCEWISEKDIPGGATFFRGPHKIPTQLIENRYANDIESFRIKCEKLSGIQIDMADAAYSFRITPRIPAAVLFWNGDNEFKPESKILFDRTITKHLAPDIIFCLAVEICERISGG